MNDSSNHQLSRKTKTVNNIRNLTWGNNDQHNKVYLPCKFEVNLITHLGVIALYSSNFKIFCRPWHAEHFCSLNLTLISYSFWNKEWKVLKFWKFDEKREITPKFEVNLITHLGVIALYSSNFKNFDTFRLIFQQL
jgi:hypothetical protein